MPLPNSINSNCCYFDITPTPTPSVTPTVTPTPAITPTPTPTKN